LFYDSGFFDAKHPNFAAQGAGLECSNHIDHKSMEDSPPMKSEYPFNPFDKKQELIAPPSRLTDEKISDESGTETNSDSALRPAELKNPFWN
jgi:hypothetical protein